MIFTIDRVQYSKTQSKFYIYEFMEIPNVKALFNPDGTLIHNNDGFFWRTIYGMIGKIETEKLRFFAQMQTTATKIYVFYQKGINAFVKIEIEPHKSSGQLLNFNGLQTWFKGLNNIDGDSANLSKGLGSVRDSNDDEYLNSLLRSLYNNKNFSDDNGLELTKQLLVGDQTRGFDLDLFQYIPSTKEYIIYEFLKRDSKYINNIQAHPMRYSWTNSGKDNKQKYISLWKAKQLFNARFFLINYSDDINEKVSVIEVLDIDEQTGFVEENKYCMSRNVFVSWLTDMNNYQKQHNKYLSDFRCENYPKTFFSNFHANKKDYGKEFDI